MFHVNSAQWPLDGTVGLFTYIRLYNEACEETNLIFYVELFFQIMNIARKKKNYK